MAGRVFKPIKGCQVDADALAALNEDFDDALQITGEGEATRVLLPAEIAEQPSPNIRAQTRGDDVAVCISHLGFEEE